MSTKEQLRQLRNEKIAEMREISQNPNSSAADARRFERLVEDVDSIKTELELDDIHAATKRKTGSYARPTHGGAPLSRGDEDVATAFASAMRSKRF
jgi:hypothetical protein